MTNNVQYKQGDTIYFRYDGGRLEKDVIKEIVEIDNDILITPTYNDYLTLTSKDLIGEEDEDVKADIALHTDKTIDLKKARNWLKFYARNYYEADEWSNFDDEELVKDFCKAMVYPNER